MLFHTWYFLFFFAVVYLVYLPLRNTRYYIHWLLGASYFFYGWWNPLYLLLIFYSTLLDYGAVQAMDRFGRRRLWLGLSIANNLFLLGFFKYANFFARNLNILFETVGVPLNVPMTDVLLPVGISFFTFQSMSYTIDCYRGKLAREDNFIRFAAFVSLFPQLVAGPIERAGNLLPQLQSKPRIYRENITDGISLFLIGLFKKVALADYLARYVDSVYAMPQFYDGAELALATFAFSWQIYFDFSGYTDMARGIARMMGFNLMLNFNHPYLATGLGDFWGRWHISLSTWFKDYVYIPLGGNRGGTLQTYKNMFLTMLISGLWHGAGWTFIIWGALHALGRIFTRELERTAFYRDKVPRLFKQIWVFAFVTFAWIFFRAENFADANYIVRKIFSLEYAMPRMPLVALFFCLSIWLYQFISESRVKPLLEHSPVKVTAAVFMVLFLLVFTVGHDEAFIYFQF